MSRLAWIPNTRHRHLAVMAVLAALALAAASTHAASAQTRRAVTSAPAPTASFTARTGVIHNKCGFFALFYAGASIAPPGTSITQYAWSFGDGSGVVTTGPSTVHFYSAGSYRVVLTVTDTDGASATASREISGGNGSPYCP